MFRDILNWLAGTPQPRRIEPLWVKPKILPRCCLTCPAMCLAAEQDVCELVKEERQQEPERFEVI